MPFWKEFFCHFDEGEISIVAQVMWFLPLVEMTNLLCIYLNLIALTSSSIKMLEKLSTALELANRTFKKVIGILILNEIKFSFKWLVRKILNYEGFLSIESTKKRLFEYFKKPFFYVCYRLLFLEYIIYRINSFFI